MVLGNADVQVTAGYTQNVVGFGWSNGVYLMMRELLSANASRGSCTVPSRVKDTAH